MEGMEGNQDLNPILISFHPFSLFSFLYKKACFLYKKACFSPVFCWPCLLRELLPAAAPDAGGLPSLSFIFCLQVKPSSLGVDKNQLVCWARSEKSECFWDDNCNSYSYVDVWGWTSAESGWFLALILADASVVSFNLEAPTCFKWTTPSLTQTFHLSCVLLPSSSSCSSSTTSLYSAWQWLYLSAPMWRRPLLKSRLFLWLNSSRHIYRKVLWQGKYSRSDSGGLKDEEGTELNTDLERFEKIVFYSIKNREGQRVDERGQKLGGRRKPQVKDGKCGFISKPFSVYSHFLVEGVATAV